MPTMWYAKNGKRPHTQQGPGISLTLEEIENVFADYELKFLSETAPSINPEAPSEYPVNVVIEVEASEGSSAGLAKPGFYLAVGVSPESAQHSLDDYRSSA